MPSNTNQQELYSSWVGLIYVFNLIVGTGALTLPAVFSNAGWLLSLIIISMLAFIGYVTVTFVIESMACANAIVLWNRIRSHRIDGESEAFEDSDPRDDNTNESTAMINRLQRCYYSLNEKIELGEMATLFYNKVGRILFFVALCIYLYGDLAIYATAISKTLVNLACNKTKSEYFIEEYDDICWESVNFDKSTVYRIFVALFAACVGPFCYFDVQKTKYLQIATSSMRWCAFTIMITIAVTMLFVHGSQGTPKLAYFAGLPGLIGASVYSFMSHHSLPSLVAPFANKDHVIRQLALDYTLICFFYILLAITGTFAFAELFDLYTLNFAPSNLNLEGGLFMEIIEYFLGLFPVFTLSSSFPIIAITLRNNLKALFSNVLATDYQNTIVKRLVFPTLAIVPPIILSLLTHNVSVLVAFTGSFAGVAVQYIIPVTLVWCARSNCARNIESTAPNKYASPFKSKFWVIFVIIWSFLCFILVSFNLLNA